jgi:hypothetical protein
MPTTQITGLLILYIEIDTASVIEANQLPVVNRVQVLCFIGLTMNSNNLTVIEGVVTTFHLAYHLTLKGNGTPVNNRRPDHLGWDSDKLRLSEFVSGAT